jgi:hypothetical protein
VYDFAEAFFAYATLSQDQYIHVCGCHLYGCFQCRGQQGRMSDNAEPLFDEVCIHVFRYNYKDTTKLTVCHSDWVHPDGSIRPMQLGWRRTH